MGLTVAFSMVYGDESADALQQRVIAIGSVVGTEADWAVLKRQWKARNGTRTFHAVDCDSDQGDFEQTSHAANKQLYKDNALLLAESSLSGFAVALNLKDYRAAFPSDPSEHPYLLCFLETVKHYRESAALLIGKRHQSVKFTFEVNAQVQHNAGELYGYYCEQPGWQEFIADEVSFANRRRCVNVQVADLLAREWMKNIDSHVGPQYRIPRASLKALLKSRRFLFRYYNNTSFEEMKRSAANYEGVRDAEFQQWRRKRGMLDNSSSRVQYFISVDPVRKYSVPFLKPEDLPSTLG